MVLIVYTVFLFPVAKKVQIEGRSKLAYAEMQPFFVFCTKIRGKSTLAKQIISIFA